MFLLGTCVAQIPIPGRSKNQGEYGMGLIVNVPLPADEVSQAVADVAQNGIIRGTKEYNKDEYITGAESGSSTPVFPAWTEDGKVFYKFKKHTLDPRNFKDSGDSGTLAVRYVVQPQGDKNTLLRIDAVYVEDFRKTIHFSNGMVESSEYKDIQDHVAKIELMKKETVEAERVKQEAREHPERKAASSSSSSSSSSQPAALNDVSADAQPIQAAADAAPAVSPEPGESVEQRVRNLRSQLERKVKSPGAPLKSAPYQTAATLKSLPTGTEVLLVIVTPYWYGVETHEGDHGWLAREQLEALR